jgi:lysophospholipase L1-like esterase
VGATPLDLIGRYLQWAHSPADSRGNGEPVNERSSVHRWRRVVRLGSTALVGLLALAGCSTAGGRVPVNRRVAIVGDSITFLSTDDITTQLQGSGYEANVVGRIGRTAAEVDSDVTTISELQPAVVVFELGTNDVTRSDRGTGSPSDFERWMTKYIAEFPNSCQIATTVSSHRPSTKMDSAAREINAWMHTHFRHVVEWDSYEWSQRQNGIAIVEPDEVHPNAAGQAALGRLDLAAVKDCLP